MAAKTRIDVLHLNWDRTSRDERDDIRGDSGPAPDADPAKTKAALAALGTGKYDLVATRQTGLILIPDGDVLDEAYRQSNTIEDYWFENGTGYWTTCSTEVRSTSVGDIIKLTSTHGDDVKVAWWVTATFGFHKVASTTRTAPTPSALDDDRIEYEERRLAACYPELYSW